VICDSPVHALPSCSSHQLGKEDNRICRKFSTKTKNTNLINEDVVLKAGTGRAKDKKPTNHI